MDTTTHLLPIIASTRIEISNSFQKRTSLINLIKNSHLELRHIPFERTDVPTFKRIREEFNSSIRPIFLKYLWKVENSFIKKHFTFFEQEKIMTGYLPIGWTVHHQRPISCGGLNYSKEFDKKIRKVPLTLEDLTSIPEGSTKDTYILGRQLARYLAEKEKKGLLTSTFYKMFQRYLILIPQFLHEELEKNILTPQKKQLSLYRKPEEDFIIPTSPLLIYGGDRHQFKEKNKSQRISRHQEEFLPLITSHLSQHLR